MECIQLNYPKKMNVEFSNIAHKQSVRGIGCKVGVIHRTHFVPIDDSVRRNRRTRSPYISNQIKDDTSIKA